jgi:hypothetical protein
MTSLPTVFVETLAYSFVIAFMMFAIIVYSRRKERAITSLKGFLVFLLGWLGGAILAFVFELLFALSGANVDSEGLKSGISIIMILSATYAAFSWLSEKKRTDTSK